MNIVIPMAGLGTRFSNSGFLLPKPLIDVAGKPMYRYSIDCLPLKLASNVLFILRESNDSDKVEEDIIQHYRHLEKCTIIKIKETRGQAETVLLGSRFVNPDEPILIHNCDTYIKENFQWSNLLTDKIDGAVVLFSSTEKRWSYAKLDPEKKYLIDFQEKEVISSNASTGTYFFKDTKALFESIQFNIHHNIREKNEFYLSSVYRSMLNTDKKIIPLWTKSMMCFGTPQDLVFSLNKLLLNQINHDRI